MLTTKAWCSSLCKEGHPLPVTGQLHLSFLVEQWTLLSEWKVGFCSNSPWDVQCFHPDRTAKEGDCGPDVRLWWMSRPYPCVTSKYLWKMQTNQGSVTLGAELQETVRRRCGIRRAEVEIDEWFHSWFVMIDVTQNEALWTLVTKKSRTPLQFPPSCITTRNRYYVLTPENTYEQALQKKTTPATHTRNHKKKPWVLIVDDSLLRSTKAPIYWPNRISCELFSLPGAKVWDITERMPQRVRNTDCYPLLLFHVGTNDTANQILGRIKPDYKALGCEIERDWCSNYSFLFY